MIFCTSTPIWAYWWQSILSTGAVTHEGHDPFCVGSLAVRLSANALKESDALLDESEKSGRPMVLSVHGYLPYHSFWGGYFPIGGGASFYIPLVHNGFIGKLNDEFGIDFGADAVARIGSAYPFSLHIPVAAQWKFHLLPQLEVYAKLGIQVDLWFGAIGRFGWPVWPIAAVGANYFFSKSFGVKLELGSAGARLGVVFGF